jgi:hypothetical protein
MTLDFVPDKLQSVKLTSLLYDVPYYSQLNNKREPMRSCNVSACAMAVVYLSPSLFFSDDDYADSLWVYGDTTDHLAHTNMLAAKGIESEFRYDLSYGDLSEQLNQHKPVVIGVYHRGSLESPTGGHMITIVGEYDDGYICHDPFGEPFHYQSEDGSYCLLPHESLDRRWLTDGNFTGWGRIFK